MITSDLISYIRDQIKNNIPKDLIKSNLLKVGWHKEDIEEGFLNVESNLNPESFLPDIKKEQKVIEVKKPEVKKESPKVWTPMSVPVKVSPVEAKKEIIKKEDSDINTNLSKKAMLSSYSSDLASLGNIKEQTPLSPKHKAIKWIIFILAVVAFAVAVTVMSGYLNFKDLNIFSIKKDPKILLLNNSKTLSSLKSYKTETNVEISSPSFSNIISGLISGEAISSLDKDSISINTLGVINKNENAFTFDNFITTKSSLLKDPVTFDVKSNGADLFILSSDLGKVINEKNSESSFVKMNESQINLILPLFSHDIESLLNKVNLYKLISSGMSSYVNNKTFGVYDDFINKVEIIEKGQENIKGIDTYHYLIHFDRESIKSLLSAIADNFASDLSSEDKDKLSQIVGSTSVDSFEVWVGKGDNNIYQYNVILSIPLSKVMSYEDKSVGDSKVSISWKTTYYDFNIANNLSVPEEFISINDFVNIIKQERIKKDVSFFKELAMNLKNAEGSYGNKSNTKGDCMNPTAGSLFSPVGHTKGSAEAISSISESLSKILKITNLNGSCYSNPKAWSFTIPISNDYDSVPSNGYQAFFCVDSTGDTKDLVAPPAGVVCSPSVKMEPTKTVN